MLVLFLKDGKKSMIRELEGIFIGVLEQIAYRGYLQGIRKQRYTKIGTGK